MFVNGVGIGMELIAVIRRQILTVLIAARTGWFVAVAGTLVRASFALLIVTTTARPTVASALASACSAVQIKKSILFFRLARLWRGLEMYQCNGENNEGTKLFTQWSGYISLSINIYDEMENSNRSFYFVETSV